MERGSEELSTDEHVVRLELQEEAGEGGNGGGAAAGRPGPPAYRGVVEHGSLRPDDKPPPTACLNPDGTFSLAYPAYLEEPGGQEEAGEEATETFFHFFVMLSNPPPDGDRRRKAYFTALCYACATVQLVFTIGCTVAAFLFDNNDANCEWTFTVALVATICGLVATKQLWFCGFAMGGCAAAIAYLLMFYTSAWSLAAALALLVQIYALVQVRHAGLAQWYGTIRTWR